MESTNTRTFKRLILTTILFFTMFLFFVNFASAYEFIFMGNVTFPNGTYVSGANVSLTVPSFLSSSPGTAFINGSYSNLTDANGNFRINVSFGNSGATEPIVANAAMLKLSIIYNGSDGNVSHIGPTLPTFPVAMWAGSQQGMPSLNNQTFYLRKAATIRLNVINQTGSAVNFSYNVRDTNLGTNIDEVMVFPPTKSTFDLKLELNRNYSVNVFPNQAPPLSLSIVNLTLTNYTGARSSDVNSLVRYFYNYTFNTTIVPKYVDGYIINSTSTTGLVSNGAVVNSSKFEMWVTNIEGGNFICAEDQCLNNLTQFQNPGDLIENGGGVVINLTSGYFNVSLPGTTTANSVLLFILVNNSGNWSLGVQNITSLIGSDAQRRQNITLRPIAGNNYIAGTNLKTPQTMIRLINSSGDSIASQGFVEMTLNYGLGFDMKIGMQTNTSGIAVFPFVTSYGVKTLKAFVSRYPPRDTSFSTSEMDGDISATLYDMKAKSFDGSSNLNSNIQLLVSNSTCDVMNPPSVCNIGSSAADSAFNPFSAILRGAVSMRMNMPGGMILHYKNVDLISSGPPDFITDSAAASGTSVRGSLADVWRFGSRGPKIYDWVIIGLNYSTTQMDTSFRPSVSFGNLYDSNSNLIWNTSANGTTYSAITGNYSEYTGFNETWFSGNACNTTGLGDNQCYYNATQAYMWLSFPHFSNIGSTIQGITVGNVTLNVTNSLYCNQTCLIYFNVTNLNYTQSLQLMNWTINSTLAGANIVISYLNLSNTNQAFIANGTNVSYYNGYNFTYYNSSNLINTTHQYLLNITRNSNATTALTINYTFVSNAGGYFDLTTIVNLTCAEVFTYSAWSTCTNSVQTRTAVDVSACGTNVTRAALSQSCTVASTAASSSGGGAGAATVSASNTWSTISAGQPYKYIVGKSDVAINTVVVTPSETLSNVKLSVRQFSEKPASITTNPVGIVYKYTEVEKTNILNSQILNAKLTFGVDKTWVDAKGGKENVVMLRYNNNLWEKLATTYAGTFGDKYQYEAVTSGFSYFAITYQTTEQKAVQVAEEKKPIAVSESDISADTNKPENLLEQKQAVKTSWMPIVIVLVCVLLIGLIAYFVHRKKQNGDFGAYRYKPNRK